MAKACSLAIVLPTLHMGGAEMTHIRLAPALMAAGWQVTFVLYRAEGILLTHVPEGVRVVSLDAGSTKAAVLPLIRYLKREQPSIVIANLVHTNLMAIMAGLLARVPTKIVVTFHNALSQECKARQGGKVLLWACRLLLPFTSKVIAVSQGVAEDLIAVTKIAKTKVQVLYNPVVDDGFTARSMEPIEHSWLSESTHLILGVGRLVPQKDFATLIHAFSRINKNINAKLIIIGDGELYIYLNELIDKLNLKYKILLIGGIANPLPYMHAASLLVLSSLYEGLGNVLIEAMACGTAVVSTDCPYGPAEILEQGRWGKLVPTGDIESLAKAIEDTLESPPSREALKKRAMNFSVKSSARHYCHLLEKLYIP